jgi:NADPH:quinone reductase-like Zn-dependent oxidoreductase
MLPLSADAAVVLGDSGEELARVVSELTGGRGAWGALDSIAGSSPLKIAPAVRVGGSIIVYGAMSSPNVEWNVGQGLFRVVALKVGRGGRTGCH